MAEVWESEDRERRRKSAFRHPPLWSRSTPIAAFMALSRVIGRGPRALEVLAAQMGSDRRRAGLLAGYEPAAHDVFVTVYHKSGTNWMLQMVQQIAWRGAAEFRHIHDVVPWVEGPFAGIVGLDDPRPWRSSPAGFRAVKTAIGAQHVPYNEAARYIHVVRDPKEVAVSFYVFLLGVLGLREQVTMDRWLELFVRPGASGLWPAHTASFWAWRDRPNVLSLRFSEMKRDLPAAVRRVAEFLGVELTQTELDRVAHRCSFAAMKREEDKFGPPILPFRPTGDPPLMMRKGTVGGSGELLSREQQAAIDRFAMAELQRLGSDFPYREYFDVVE